MSSESVNQDMPPDARDAEFDECAAEYEQQLQQGLAISGEGGDYFARERTRWLAKRLASADQPQAILDFGCGTGTAAPFFREQFDPRTLVGVDVSEASLQIAAQRHAEQGAEFRLVHDVDETRQFDLAYCSGVFHHIVPEERIQSATYVADRLRPGGLFSFWENNPWNPGTRYIMSRIPFDRDAICLTYLEAKRLLRDVGLEVERVDFCFWFPAALKWLRPLEPWLRRVPVGAQFHVLARKPAKP